MKDDENVVPHLDLLFFSLHKEGPSVCTEKHAYRLLVCPVLLLLLEFDLKNNYWHNMSGLHNNISGTSVPKLQ